MFQKVAICELNEAVWRSGLSIMSLAEEEDAKGGHHGGDWTMNLANTSRLVGSEGR